MEIVRAQTGVALSCKEAGFHLEQATSDVGGAVVAATTEILRKEEMKVQATWSPLQWRLYEV